MQGVSQSVDLFSVIGVNVEREQLYTAAIACIGDDKNGLYWAVRTVDKDSRSKQWNVYVIYVGNGGAPRLAYLFKQGTPELPWAAGGAALARRSDGKIVLTITADSVAGSLFPPRVFVLDPVA